MSRDAHKLTIYFGERDRLDRQFLADRLLALFAEHRLTVSVLLRGAEGFGIKHQLRTDRLLTLSEDLPLVAVAIDEPQRIAPVLAQVSELGFDGLITVERARLAGRSALRALPPDAGEEIKLTAYLGRGRRNGRRPAYEEAVRVLHEHGVAGATVLVGVDGTIEGSRQRARFFSRNAGVPAMLISIGARERIEAALPELAALPGELGVTIERVRVLKRDGRTIGALSEPAAGDGEGLDRWIKLVLYSSEANAFEGRPVHLACVRALRAEDAPGATALRGIWGYHGSHAPHGDTLWSLRRRVPTVTVVVDRPDRIGRWLEILDRATPERGLITAEVVPAFRARGGGAETGGLRLATKAEPGP